MVNIRGVLKNTQTNFLSEKRLMLSVMLLHQNKLEIIFSILIYNLSRYLKLVIDSARLNLDVLYKIAISR